MRERLGRVLMKIGLECENVGNNSKMQFDSDLEATMKSLEKEFELHQKRLESLRQVADRLKSDAWRYPSMKELGL